MGDKLQKTRARAGVFTRPRLGVHDRLRGQQAKEWMRR
jgi:hypothetical protein